MRIRKGGRYEAAGEGDTPRRVAYTKPAEPKKPAPVAPTPEVTPRPVPPRGSDKS